MENGIFPEALFPNDKNVLHLIKKLTGNSRANLTSDADLMTHWRLLLLLTGDRDILSYGKKSIGMLEKTGIEYKIFKGCGHSINHE